MMLVPSTSAVTPAIAPMAAAIVRMPIMAVVTAVRSAQEGTTPTRTISLLGEAPARDNKDDETGNHEQQDCDARPAALGHPISPPSPRLERNSIAKC